MYDASSFGKFVDLETLEELQFGWDPNEIKQAIKARRSKQQIPGLSHRRSQFVNTDNQEIKFTLTYDALQHGGPIKVDAARQWLFSLLYPRSSNRIQGAGQPKVLLLIPRNLNVKGYVEGVEITQELLFSDGSMRRFSAAITFDEELERRLTSGVVRNMLLSRGGASRNSSRGGGR